MQKGWRGTRAPGPQRPAQPSNVASEAQQGEDVEPEAGSQSQALQFLFFSFKTKQPKDRLQFPKSDTSALDKYKFHADF